MHWSGGEHDIRRVFSAEFLPLVERRLVRRIGQEDDGGYIYQCRVDSGIPLLHTNRIEDSLRGHIEFVQQLLRNSQMAVNEQERRG